jgi:hypothetical protein
LDIPSAQVAESIIRTEIKQIIDLLTCGCLEVRKHMTKPTGKTKRDSASGKKTVYTPYDTLPFI